MASLDDEDTKAAILDCHVCIVGAGIGGLMMGILLERADIKYTILEKHPFHNPLGNISFTTSDDFSFTPLFRHMLICSTKNYKVVNHGFAHHIFHIMLYNVNIFHTTHAILLHYIGSAICLEPSVQPLFRQLGLMDEIHRLSKPFGALVFREDNLNIIGTFSAQTPLDINDR
jgi:hypothetical protein